MGQLLPSMGEMYFLKVLTQEAAVFAGAPGCSQRPTFTSGFPQGPFIGLSWAIAVPADTKKYMISIILILVMCEISRPI